MTTILGIDIETYSATTPQVSGAWAYSEHPSTGVHCAVFGLCDSPTGVVKTATWKPGEEVPSWAVAHILAGRPLLAHNASFEMAIIENVLSKRHGWPLPAIETWEDTLHYAAAANLPLGLGALAAALKGAIPKDKEGSELMKRVARVEDGPDGYVYPVLSPQDEAELISYCETDVLSMFSCWWRLPRVPVDEVLTMRLDRKIGRRGVYLDLPLVDTMSRMTRARKLQLAESAYDDSGAYLKNAISAPGMKVWLKERGVVLPMVRRKRKDGSFEMTPSIDRKTVLDLLKKEGLASDVQSVLETRLEAGKATSLAKLNRVPKMVGRDGRLHFALRYSKANTGRWSSEGLQVHNLPKDLLGGARSLVHTMVREGDLEGLEFVVGQPLDGLSQALRSTIIAPPGKELIGGDFSAVEARVLAWLAGQDDVLDVFASGRDIYVEDAAKIGSTNRQLGKVQRLALGYGMGALTFVSAALGYKVVLTRKEARRVQLGWRAANPMIVQFWADIEQAFRDAIATPHRVFYAGLVMLRGDGTCVQMRLPSGRSIRYWRPHTKWVKKKIETVDDNGDIVTREFETEEIRYFAPKGGGMRVESTYGGKLAENATQAVARDLMARALLRVDAVTPYDIVMHVHDSILSEVPTGTGDVREFCDLMAEQPEWAPDLPIAVEGYRGAYFRG
jgi:DNA polymerase